MEARFKNLPQLCRATERGDAPVNPGQPVGADFLRLGQVHQAGEHLFGAAFLEHGKHRAGVLGEVERALGQPGHPAALLMAHRLREGVVDPFVARMP